MLGFTGGEIPTLKVNRLLLNNVSVVGVGWGAFWMGDPGYVQEQWRDLQPLLERGALDPVLGTVEMALQRELPPRRDDDPLHLEPVAAD